MKLPTDCSAGPVFGTITVTVADEAADRLEAASWLEAEHFRGSFKPAGLSGIQIICEDARPVALMQGAASAYWRTTPGPVIATALSGRDQRITSLAPGRMICGRRTASQLAKRTHPALSLRPMVCGLAVPWRPMPLRLVLVQITPTGLLGPMGS